MIRPVHRAALSAALCVLVPGALVGTAVSARAADTKPDTITASAPVPGAGYQAQTVVMPRGTATITYTPAGITKYVVGPHRIVRTGTAAAAPDAEHPFGERLLAHPAGGYVYLVWQGKVQIFDVSKSTPRLVRTLGNGAGTATFAPDGRRLFLADETQIRVLGTKNAARPTRGASLPTTGVSELAVTPDGAQLVSGETVDSDATVTTYTLPHVGAPVAGPSARVVVPGWQDDWATTVDLLKAAPDGLGVYVSVGTYSGDKEIPDQALAKVSLADFATAVLPGTGAVHARAPFLQDLTANGNRVYFTYGATTDEDEHMQRALSWADRNLAAAHDVDPIGDVLAAAISPASATRGLAYVVVLTKSGMELRSVKVW